MPDDVVPLEIRMAGPEVVAAWRDPRGVLAELSRARAEAERLRRVIGVLYMNRGHARHPLTKLLRQAFGDRLNPDEHTRPLSVGPTGKD